MKPYQYCLKRSALAEGKSPEIVMLFQILSNPNHSMILWRLHLQCQFCLHIRQMEMWNGADSQLLESSAKKLYFWGDNQKHNTSFDYEILLWEWFHAWTVPVPLLFPFTVFKLKIFLLGYFFFFLQLNSFQSSILILFNPVLNFFDTFIFLFKRSHRSQIGLLEILC